LRTKRSGTGMRNYVLRDVYGYMLNGIELSKKKIEARYWWLESVSHQFLKKYTHIFIIGSEPEDVMLISALW